MHVIEAMRGLTSPSPLPAVSLVVGESSYWADTWLRGVYRKAQTQYGVVERVRLGGEGGIDWDHLLATWRTPDLLNRAQMFIVDNFNGSPRADASPSWFAEGGQRHLVVYEAKRGSLSKWWGDLPVVEATPPPPALWRRWVLHLAKSREIVLDASGADLLIRLIPSDGYHLDQELDKLRLLRAEVERWNESLVAEWVLPEIGEEAVWTVTDALMAKDRAAFYRALDHALTDGKPPVMLLALIGRQLVQLGRAQRSPAMADFQTTEKVPAFVARKVYAHAKQWSDDELSTAIQWLAKLDRWFKLSMGDPAVALTTFALTVGNTKKRAHGRR